MTDSGFPIKPVTGGTNPQAEAAKPNVKLTTLPSELQNVSRPVRVSGEVTDVKSDGTATIKTNQGNIEVQIRDVRLQRMIAEGQKIEIQIPPGSPPREAQVTLPSVRPAPERTVETLVDIIVKPTPLPQETSSAPSAPPPSLEPGAPLPAQPIKLESIPIEQVLPMLKAEVIEQVILLTAQNAAIPVDDLQEIFTPQTPVSTAALATSTPVIIEEIFAPGQPLNLSPAPAMEMPQPFIINFEQPAPSPLSALNIPLYEGEASTQIPAAIQQPIATIIPDIANLYPAQPMQIMPQTQATLLPMPQKAPVEITAMQIALHDLALQTPALSTTITQEATTENLIRQFFSQQSPLILDNQKAGEHTGIVIGKTEGNFPIILVPSVIATEKPQAFILQAPFETIIPGTQITFTMNDAIMTPVAAGMPVQTVMTASSFGFLDPQPWPLMTQILGTLAASAPQAAQLLTNMTPSPANPSQMGAAALFFIAAIRSGDLTSWLGEKTIDALRRGGNNNLLSRLGQEGASISRIASEPLTQDWRAMSLPFFMDQEMHKVTLYYKNDDGSRQDKENKGGQTRFVMDLNLSQIGPVQLDALFKPGRLDVILRTEDSFSPVMQQEMRDLYANALRQTQITGELLFQDQPQQWVKITPDNRNIGVSV